VALVRLEQLYPFPEEQLKAVLARYPKAHRWVWVQEEPQNMGAWLCVENRLRDLLRERNRKAPADRVCELGYVCRDASASPATGSYQIHDREQRELIDAALNNLVPYLVRAVPPAVEKPTDARAPK
jgi:2-oxoglutarate dehydrogenase E1 component